MLAIFSRKAARERYLKHMPEFIKMYGTTLSKGKYPDEMVHFRGSFGYLVFLRIRGQNSWPIAYPRLVWYWLRSLIRFYAYPKYPDDTAGCWANLVLGLQNTGASISEMLDSRLAVKRLCNGARREGRWL